MSKTTEARRRGVKGGGASFDPAVDTITDSDKNLSPDGKFMTAGYIKGNKTQLCLTCGRTCLLGYNVCPHCGSATIVFVSQTKMTPFGCKDPKEYHEQLRQRVDAQISASINHRNHPEVYPMPEPMLLDITDAVYLNRHYRVWRLYTRHAFPTLDQMNISIDWNPARDMPADITAGNIEGGV